MGIGASKQWEAAELSTANAITKNLASGISSELVTKSTTAAESKGKSWIDSESNVLWTAKPVARFKPHSFIHDKNDNLIAVVISHRLSMNSCTNYICKLTPSYENQEAMTEEQLTKSSLDKTMKLYGFAKIDTKRGMSSASCTYSIMVGDDKFEPLYTGEKLSAMGFFVLMKENDVVVAKAHTKGIRMKPVIEVAPGVDLLAVVFMGYALAGDGSAAGALAGAGVV